MSVLRDLALILLALEGIFLTLVVVGLLAAINYGLFYLRWWHVLPQWFAVARDYLAMGQKGVEWACRMVTRPFLMIASLQDSLLRGLRGGSAEPPPREEPGNGSL